jgi:hypothetical protein
VLGRFFDGAEAEVSSCREMQAEYCDRCLKKGVNRVGNREDIREDNAEDKEEDEEEDKEEEDKEEEDKEEDNNNEAERVPAVTIVNRLKENIQEESRRMIKLYGWLDQVRGVGCSVCFVKWHMHGAREELRGKMEHGRKDCRLLRQKDFDRWQASLRFADYECCWECGLPYSWCSIGQVQGGKCSYRNTILPVVMMVKVSETVQGLVRDRFGVDCSDEQVYRNWIKRSRRVYGVPMTNGLAVWDEIIQYISR